MDYRTVAWLSDDSKQRDSYENSLRQDRTIDRVTKCRLPVQLPAWSNY